MNKKAFSLVELSVVLIAIGILTVAITKGSSLIYSSRVASAKSLTGSSKIHKIEGLVAWYENVLPDSLDSSGGIDNEPVAYWQDISSQFNIAEENNRLTTVESSDVVYRRDGIGKLPSLQFTSSGRLTLSSLYSGLSNMGSVFMVLSPTLAFGGSKMTALDSFATSSNSISLTSSTLDMQAASNQSVSYNFSAGEEYVIGVNLNETSKVFVNNIDSAGSATMAINGFNGLTIGTDMNGANNFTGLISEVIIFDKVLTKAQRIHIMSYLSKKYKIRVEGAAI